MALFRLSFIVPLVAVISCARLCQTAQQHRQVRHIDIKTVGSTRPEPTSNPIKTKQQSRRKAFSSSEIAFNFKGKGKGQGSYESVSFETPAKGKGKGVWFSWQFRAPDDDDTSTATTSPTPSSPEIITDKPVAFPAPAPEWNWLPTSTKSPEPEFVMDKPVMVSSPTVDWKWPPFWFPTTQSPATCLPTTLPTAIQWEPMNSPSTATALPVLPLPPSPNPPMEISFGVPFTWIPPVPDPPTGLLSRNGNPPNSPATYGPATNSPAMSTRDNPVDLPTCDKNWPSFVASNPMPGVVSTGAPMCAVENPVIPLVAGWDVTIRPSTDKAAAPAPSGNPTLAPFSTQSPLAPTGSDPDEVESVVPSSDSNIPTIVPTIVPSQVPTAVPSNPPTCDTDSPTAFPTLYPSAEPSLLPSSEPQASPSQSPSYSPTTEPSVRPTSRPSKSPTALPSPAPSSLPSARPTGQPSPIPSEKPSLLPSTIPSVEPSSRPSTLPTALPSSAPMTERPSTTPTDTPSCPDPSASPLEIALVKPSSQPVFMDAESSCEAWVYQNCVRMDSSGNWDQPCQVESPDGDLLLLDHEDRHLATPVATNGNVMEAVELFIVAQSVEEQIRMRSALIDLYRKILGRA